MGLQVGFRLPQADSHDFVRAGVSQHKRLLEPLSLLDGGEDSLVNCPDQLLQPSRLNSSGQYSCVHSVLLFWTSATLLNFPTRGAELSKRPSCCLKRIILHD